MANRGKCAEHLSKAVEEHFQMIDREIVAWHSSSGVGPGTLLDVVRHGINQLPLTILSRVVYGDDLTDAEINEIVELGNEHIALLDKSLELASNIKLSAMSKKSAEFRSKWLLFNNRMLERLALEKPEQLLLRKDAFSVAVGHFMQQEGGMEQNYLKFVDTLDEILLLNIDVTYVALMNLLSLVASDENVSKELYSEIRQTCVENTENSIDFETLSKLPYLDAVLKESIRLRPPLTLSFPERTSQPIELGGYRIPAGTAVMIDADSINHDPAVWPNPDSFDPSRFLDNKDSEIEYKYFKYGLNAKRKCLGFRYAEAIIKRFVWEIFTSYDVSIRAEDYSKWLTECRDSGVPFFTAFCNFPKLELKKWPAPSPKDGIVRIDDGISLPCFVLGERAIQAKGSVIFGMSFGNSYYTKDCIKQLIPFLASKFSRFFIDVPDEWTIQTYLALGYTQCQLRRKLKYQTNRLRRYCQAGVDLACSMGYLSEQFIFMDWARDVETSENYQLALKQLVKAYEEDAEFRYDCNSTTLGVLQSQGKDRGFDQKTEAEQAAAVKIAVKYVHMELAESIAFGQIAHRMTAGRLAEDTPAAMVYHRRWPVLEKLFSGEYEHAIFKNLVEKYSPNFGFVIFESNMRK